MGNINVAVIGVGNCVSSLVQGISYYKKANASQFVPGLMHVNLGGYHISDINFVAAFDIDKQKVGNASRLATRSQRLVVQTRRTSITGKRSAAILPQS